jgi:hypothetical protein
LSELPLRLVLGAAKLTRGEQILLLLHMAEQRGMQDSSPGDLGAMFDEARVPVPNLSRELEKLRRAGLVISRSGRWVLSQVGLTESNAIMEKSGLASAANTSQLEPLRRVSVKLQSQAAQIANDDLRSFASEALRCLDPAVAALRAATVLGWAGGVARLKERLWQKGQAAIVAELGRLGWRVRIAKEADLDDLKDVQLVGLGHELGLYDKAAKKALESALDFRNACAHPTDVAAGIHKVEAFFEDVLPLLYL